MKIQISIQCVVLSNHNIASNFKPNPPSAHREKYTEALQKSLSFLKKELPKAKDIYVIEMGRTKGKRQGIRVVYEGEALQTNKAFEDEVLKKLLGKSDFGSIMGGLLYSSSIEVDDRGYRVDWHFICQTLSKWIEIRNSEFDPSFSSVRGYRDKVQWNLWKEICILQDKRETLKKSIENTGDASLGEKVILVLEEDPSQAFELLDALGYELPRGDLILIEQETEKVISNLMKQGKF